MPHVASPSQLFAADLKARLRQLQRIGLDVRCDGAEHRLSFDGRTLHADDHDDDAEAVLRAVGGRQPPCLALVDRIATASPPELWAALTPLPAAPATGTAAGGGDELQLLGTPALRLLLARGLQDEFAAAGLAVRDAVAQLGLALLGVPDDHLHGLADKFRLTRQFPTWDPGPGPWSDRELALLARYLRASPGEAVAHLELLPSDPSARRAVAKYARGLLDTARVLTAEELQRRLAPTYRNVRALTALLVAEGQLELVDGRYRLRDRPVGPATARATRQRRRRQT